MRTRTFGPMRRHVPVIGQGTWQLPDRGAAAERSVTALRLGIQLNLCHIDTAEMYGDGRAEELVADAIAGVARDRLFIVSKVLPQHASFRGTIRACEASLRRLRLDYLDVFLLHWQSRHPISETMGAMEQLMDEGKIAALGVSNFDVADLEAARAALQRHPLACNQVLYHVRERAAEALVLPYCQRHGIALVGYSPFGQGDFPSPRSGQGAALSNIAQRHDATPRQVALAFLTREQGTFTVPKASDEQHLRENAAAGDLELTPSDIKEIEAAFPLRHTTSLPVL
ncbi:MAG: oxidoreductase [Candidatus Eremiobacter antarcticus]|nr:aldo/keto reductase [Candidatus Eremiobacteraeota bacterium]MBC5808362.1 aldo/keto reductase [Candidatus Eremiobacteraeota bacterium]PZR63845.1 MAG: oxidoreductase [Candidatus Eremiobacter sp. RRmetagenome_bin22]